MVVFRNFIFTLLLAGGVLFAIDNPSPLASGRLDSLRQLVAQPGTNDTTRIDALLHLSWDLKSIEPMEALEYGKKALEIAEEGNYPVKAADALRHIGVVYWQLGNFNMAMDFLQESNIMFQREGDQVGTARTFSNIGLVFWEQGHYEKALENYFQALRILENIEDQSVIAPVLNNIGLVYQSQGDFALAGDFHLRSLEVKRATNDEKGIAFSLNNLGVVKQQTGDYETALQYYSEALAIRKKLLDKREIANTRSNIGYLYYLMGNSSFALSNLNQALELYFEVNDQSGLAQTYHNLALVNRQMGRLTQATGYFETSLEIAENIGHSRIIADNYLNLASISAMRREYQKAYNYQKLYLNLRDSLFTRESQQRIMEMQMMYDRERKESEIELLRKTNQINALNLQKQSLLKNFLLGGVVLILILLFLLYNRFLFITRSNRLLERQKDEISQNNQKLTELNKTLLVQKQKVEELNQRLNQTNQRLIESEKHLIETNATKDKFFSIISHDLRNPFASIVSFSRILKRDIQNLGEEELQELARELDKSVLKINNLLENLLQWSRTQTGKMKFHPEYLAVSDLIRDNINLFSGNAREKEITLVDSVDPDLVVFADQNMTNTLVRNLLSNALKYSDAGSKIEVTSQVLNKMAHISVKDNGVGMTREQMDQLWSVNTIHTTYGTRDEKGSGLGLLLCKEFIEKQGGQISVKSEKGKGSNFTFSLPLEKID
ncbi:MAG: tetratricopeptide repeat-containing sensor histidine kinase [Bacteroidales bacterium]|nr:tetratricopeptide repeat-containing sensor histidine kinase [Bacteroidales bacterium]